MKDVKLAVLVIPLAAVILLLIIGNPEGALWLALLVLVLALLAGQVLSWLGG